MTNPEDIQHDANVDPESSTDEATADANLEAAGEELAGADYQARLREFDKVESSPVVSLPVKSSQLDESDFKVQSPGG